MEYNTARNQLVIPEYGRNVQKMVDYVLTIEDREKRTNAAKVVITSMAQMNPSIKETADFNKVLWDHLYVISEFKLDVDGPYPKPEKEKLFQRPDKIEYSNSNITLRHYGKHLVTAIEKAIEYEEGEERQALIVAIANQMKRSYLKWNRDSVNDITIAKHLHTLSRGKLILPDDVKLIAISEVIQRPKYKKKKSPHKSYQKSYKDYGKDNYKKKRKYSSKY